MRHILRLVAKALQQKFALRKRPEEILDLQQKRLRALVALAKTESPFYAERFRNIDPERFKLADLPTLTKPDMMANFDDLVTDRRLKRTDIEEFMSDQGRLGQWYLGEFAVSRTSGTQGQPAVIVQDRRMMELLFAIQMTRGSAFPTTVSTIVKRLFLRARLAVVTIGHGFYPSAAALAYAPAAARFFVNRLWLTHIEPIVQVVDQLNRFQPHVLLAYANVLEILAREALAGRLRIGHGNHIRQIINMSEPLSDGARKLAERAFGLKITNNYATGECMALSTGCLQGHGMHLQADWAILEVVDREHRPVPPGQPGEKVLLTNLYNTVQPFIRYEVADVVTMSPTPCPCGVPLPLILQVEGRTDEVVWIQVGGEYRRVHPYVFVDCLEEYPAIGWFQVLQTERNRFQVRVNPAPGRRIERSELEAVLQRGLGSFQLDDLIQVDIEITDQVSPDPRSGKLKRITSRVGPPPELNGQANGQPVKVAQPCQP